MEPGTTDRAHRHCRLPSYGPAAAGPSVRKFLATAVAGTAFVLALAPAASAKCDTGRIRVVQAPSAQLFILGNAERRWVWYVSDTFPEAVTTCGLKAISRVPGIILHGYGGERGAEVALNSIDPVSSPPRWFSLGIEVTASTPGGDGVIEFHNKSEGGIDGNGRPFEPLIVGTVRVHVNQPAVIVGDLVGTSAFIDSADVGGRTLATTTPSRWSCPAGYALAGSWRYSDGFWLCARADLAGRAFWLGDAERSGLSYFKVRGGASASYAGSRRWDACDGGTWLARHGDATGWWVCMEGAMPDVLVGDVRDFTTLVYAVYGGAGTTDRTYVYGTLDWNACPMGYMPVGADVHENGFWVCARTDLARRAFWVGDIEDGVGYYYKLALGTLTFLGTTRPWNSCDAGTVPVGRRTKTDGFWVCIDAPRRTLSVGF